jgi:hypothetical protein
MPNSIDLVASQPHYRDHLLPIWNATPDELKGTDWGDKLCRDQGRKLLVAGYSDIQRHVRNHFIYVEHGAGQSYINMDRGADSYYSGGGGHQHTLGFLCPNSEVADRWKQRYKLKPAIPVGCPRLDPWHRGDRANECDNLTVAITFHWDAQFTGVEETKSCFGYYLSVLPEFVRRWKSRGWKVLGHHHPRFPALRDYWQSAELQEAGVQATSDVNLVLDKASTLIADNTSLQAEFLSLGRKVVWLNHPEWIRRREEGLNRHGQRFWTWPTLSGTQLDSPEELLQLELETVPAATWHPYVDGDVSLADGHASERAASALVELLK